MPEKKLLPRIAKHMRTSAGVSISDLASRLGFTRCALYQIEKETNACTEATLAKYATAMGLDLKEAMIEALVALSTEGQAGTSSDLHHG